MYRNLLEQNNSNPENFGFPKSDKKSRNAKMRERDGPVSAGEREGNNLSGVKDFRTENGSGQQQNLAYLFQVRSIADLGSPQHT